LRNSENDRIIVNLIILGPEGGFAGGQIVGEGTPEQIVEIEESYTGKYLKKVL